MNEEQITEVLYSTDVDKLLEVVREKFAFREVEIASLRKEHQELCVQWVAALGNPADPYELDKAIAESPALRTEVKELRAFKASVPWQMIETLCNSVFARESPTPELVAADYAFRWIRSCAPKEPTE